MHFTVLAKLSWALGSVMNIALLLVITLRGRWRQFPVLTTWLAFLSVRSILLFAL